MTEGIFPGRFDGRKAIVTGGASGIGGGIVKRLVAEGAEVMVWDLRPSDIPGVTSQAVDVTDLASVEAAVEGMETLDVLVCSAGIVGPTAPVWEYPVDGWHAVYNLNVHGLFHCCRVAVPLMLKQNYGRIVNLASIAGKEGNPNASAYSSSKAAVIGFTKSLGKELATTGVTANCVAPAVIGTPLLDQLSEEFTEFLKSKIPMQRFGTVEEMAGMVCWLASEEASFCTGAVFDQSGGRATY